MTRKSAIESPRISVIVCTVGRPDSFETAMRYMAEQSYSNYELIVVDNGCDDKTEQIVRDLRNRTSLEVRLVREDRRGLSFARNTGIAESVGEILAFTDDDCYAAPDWLERIAEAFVDPDVAFAGGQVLLFDPDDAPMAIQLSQTPKAYRAGRYVTAGDIHGANMSFRRVVFDSIGGFDTRLGAGQKLCPEDSDALNRAAAAGFAGVYDPAIVVSHHHRRRGQEAATMDKVYAQGRGALMMKLWLSGSPLMQKLAPVKPFVGNLKRTPIYFVWELDGAIQYLIMNIVKPERLIANN